MRRRATVQLVPRDQAQDWLDGHRRFPPAPLWRPFWPPLLAMAAICAVVWGCVAWVVFHV